MFGKSQISKRDGMAFSAVPSRFDMLKLPVRKMLLVFSLIDAFIMAFTASFITALPVNTVFQMLIGFVLLFALIYALYEIYGRHLVKKYKKKEGK